MTSFELQPSEKFYIDTFRTNFQVMVVSTGLFRHSLTCLTLVVVIFILRLPLLRRGIKVRVHQKQTHFHSISPIAPRGSSGGIMQKWLKVPSSFKSAPLSQIVILRQTGLSSAVLAIFALAPQPFGSKLFKDTVGTLQSPNPQPAPINTCSNVNKNQPHTHTYEHIRTHTQSTNKDSMRVGVAGVHTWKCLQTPAK